MFIQADMCLCLHVCPSMPACICFAFTFKIILASFFVIMMKGMHVLMQIVSTGMHYLGS